jgi:hypothetical protein
MKTKDISARQYKIYEQSDMAAFYESLAQPIPVSIDGSIVVSPIIAKHYTLWGKEVPHRDSWVAHLTVIEPKEVKEV